MFFFIDFDFNNYTIKFLKKETLLKRIIKKIRLKKIDITLDNL